MFMTTKDKLNDPSPFISAMQNRYKIISYSRKIISDYKDNEASSVVDNKLHHPKTPHHVQIGSN